MCEECKCTVYIDEVTGENKCDNGCECCNDPEYISPSDALASVIVKAQLALYKLESALAIFNDPCDSDSLEVAIQQVEHAVTRLNSIEGVK
jgi:hypothetical protein